MELKECNPKRSVTHPLFQHFIVSILLKIRKRLKLKEKKPKILLFLTGLACFEVTREWEFCIVP